MENKIMDIINNLIKNGNEVMAMIYEIAFRQQKIKQFVWGLASSHCFVHLCSELWFLLRDGGKRKMEHSQMIMKQILSLEQ